MRSATTFTTISWLWQAIFITVTSLAPWSVPYLVMFHVISLSSLCSPSAHSNQPLINQIIFTGPSSFLSRPVSPSPLPDCLRSWPQLATLHSVSCTWLPVPWSLLLDPACLWVYEYLTTHCFGLGISGFVKFWILSAYLSDIFVSCSGIWLFPWDIVTSLTDYLDLDFSVLLSTLAFWTG